MSFLVLSFISALLNWLAVWTEIKWLEYIFKPLTMVFLIVWFFNQLPSAKPFIAWVILAGLLFSLLGDILLMLPGDWFLAGLIAFLFAQIVYTIAFNQDGVQLRLASILIAIVILAIASVIYLQLRKGLQASGNHGLIVPVTIYVLVISIMLWSASTSLTRPEWIMPAAILVTAGAAFFFLSDATLGWNRFVSPIPQGSLIVIITYHIAQYLISFGILYRLGLLAEGLFG